MQPKRLDLSMAFAVPEPASAAMMAAGLGLITLVAAKTRAASASQFKAPGYGTLDVGGWLKLGKQTTLRATVHNVGDKKYWQWADVKNVTSSATLQPSPVHPSSPQPS